MSKIFSLQRKNASAGITTVEYGILFALVGILGILSLQNMGYSVSGLFGSSSDAMTQKGTLNLLNTSAAGGSVQWLNSQQGPVVFLKGSGYYTVSTDAATGAPAFKIVNGADGVATNVSSIDGTMINSLGTSLLATKLNQFAQLPDVSPTLQDYYAQLSKLTASLALAEGFLDKTPNVLAAIPQDSGYENTHAMQDIVLLKQQLLEQMTNPPAELDQTAFLSVIPLVSNSYNVAQNYVNNQDLYGVSVSTEVPKATAAPGSAKETTAEASSSGNTEKMAVATTNEPDVKSQKPALYDAVSPDEIQKVTDSILKDKHLSTNAVNSTLNAAEAVAKIGAASASPIVSTGGSVSTVSTSAGLKGSSILDTNTADNDNDASSTGVKGRTVSVPVIDATKNNASTLDSTASSLNSRTENCNGFNSTELGKEETCRVNNNNATPPGQSFLRTWTPDS